MFLSGPVASYMINMFGLRRALLLAGALCTSGLFIAAFADSIFIIFISFGAVNGEAIFKLILLRARGVGSPTNRQSSEQRLDRVH